MLQNEFEALLGKSVSPEVFDSANKMYMESPLRKEDFVKEYKKHHLGESEVVNSLLQSLKRANDMTRQLNKDIEKALDIIDNQKKQIAVFLIQQDLLATNDSLRTMAIELIGEREYIKTKIEMGFALSSEDSQIIATLI